MRTHIRTVHGGKPHKCPNCDIAFSQPSKLKNHIESVHNFLTKPQKCRYCKYVAPNKYDLESHILSVHGKKSFKCSHFDVRWSTVWESKKTGGVGLGQTIRAISLNRNASFG